ncbi:hypothetical protein AB0M02_27240 [Actinoplanes sp. NPDC051861]|uniref:hypothetical protein n=1 Tax=Actinoplanes sp. NPDC051861 TaxID=3155170 RepID=UPI003426AD94
MTVLFWQEAGRECRRVARVLGELITGELAEVVTVLPPHEVRHLRHTVFRINSLLYLYAKLLRRPHRTELGVLLGAITHLLDHVYDQPGAAGGDVRAFEEVVFQRREPDPAQPIQVALASLAREAWCGVADRAELSTRLAAMLHTQRCSQAQVGPAVAGPALWQLTSDKGHHSLCLYFAAVNPRFGTAEAQALRGFGSYLQYMDDLEDLHEDRAEWRQSPVRGVLSGIVRGTVLLTRALRDIRSYYPRPRHKTGVFVAWLLLFHAGIMVGALVREITCRLPVRVQEGLDRRQERLGSRIPFFYVAPLSFARRPGNS